MEDSTILDREKRAQDLLNETKLLNIVRLAKILIEIYGFDEAFQKVGDKEGQEIELYFPSLNGYITFVLTRNRSNFEPRFGKSKNPVTLITVNVKKDDVVPIFSEIVRLKYNFNGILKFFFKFYITRKIKIKGSLASTLKLMRCLAIGKHKMYKFKEKKD
jgi:hypothetical protein